MEPVTSALLIGGSLLVVVGVILLVVAWLGRPR